MKTHETYEEYKSRIGELSVKIVLEKLGGLSLIKIKEKQNQSNPDYEVKNQGKLIANCEVKSLVDSFKKNEPEIEIGSEAWTESMRKKDKNHRDKLKQHLGKAISQLSKHSELPQIVCFVSFDMTDYIDMGQVLQEHIELYPKDKIPDVFILMKIHQSTTPSEYIKITETIRIMFNSKRGEDFSSKYLSWQETIKKAGSLPLTFKLKAD